MHMSICGMKMCMKSSFSSSNLIPSLFAKKIPLRMAVNNAWKKVTITYVTKNLWFLWPIQVPNHGQWWSWTEIQQSQMLQWNTRGVLMILHVMQRLHWMSSLFLDFSWVYLFWITSATDPEFLDEGFTERAPEAWYPSAGRSWLEFWLFELLSGLCLFGSILFEKESWMLPPSRSLWIDTLNYSFVALKRSFFLMKYLFLLSYCSTICL